MKKIIVENYEELSDITAHILIAEMIKDKRTNLSITAGASPKGTYSILTKWCKKYKNDLSNVHYYSFDEMSSTNEVPTFSSKLLYDGFYNDAKVYVSNINTLTPENYSQYDEKIEKDGGLDLMLIGLGEDGHFCGNMPIATDFDQLTYGIKIKEEYPWYNDIKSIYSNGEIPEYLFTMGLKSIMRVKHLVLIVNGTHKADAVKKMLESEISNSFPASALRLHPNFTIILDKEAASLL